MTSMDTLTRFILIAHVSVSSIIRMPCSYGYPHQIHPYSPCLYGYPHQIHPHCPCRLYGYPHQYHSHCPCLGYPVSFSCHVPMDTLTRFILIAHVSMDTLTRFILIAHARSEEHTSELQ